MNIGLWSRVLLTVFGLITLGAVDADAVSSGTAEKQDQKSTTEVTFTRDVAPILFNNCAACHRPGGAGPFSLLTYRDAKSHARQIAAVTSSRYMPPWLPEPGYGKFVGERRLTEQQIQTIQQWVTAGTPEGNDRDLPPVPSFSTDWELGKPDLVVKLPPYVLLAGADTDSWPRFVVPVPFSGTRYVRGVEIHPGNPALVHHCYIAVDRTHTLHIANGEVYEVGSTGMDGQFASGNSELDSRFLTWRPGSPPYMEPEGMTWRLDKDTDLILIMHLLSPGKSELIQPSVGFYFSDQPPTKTPMILRLEQDGNIDIPAGVKNFEISDDLILPVDVKVLSILPHAHYLCKEMRVFATLPDGTRQWLIWIKRWDFDWQGVFRYAEPVSLPKGTVLSMHYTYDNSSDNPRNPNSPPKHVTGGQKSTEEMADAWLEVLPGHREDLYELEIAMMRHKLAKYPDEPSGYADLGAALRAKGKNREALDTLRQAEKLDPDNVQVQNNLGAVLGSLGNFDEAIGHFQDALNLRPDYFMACFNLANALRLHGDLQHATEYLQRAVTLKPDSVEAHNQLGLIEARQGNLGEAITQFQESLRLKPDDTLAQDSLKRARAALESSK